MAFKQTACKSCGSSLVSRLFCFSCKKIQSFSKEVDFFEVLGFSVDFEVDLVVLEERYQRLSLELHPDFFESSTESEKLHSEKASAILNTAYKTIREPISRACYLLNLFSKNQKLDERSLPEKFLDEIFLLQETLDELVDKGKKSELLTMRKDLRLKQNKIEKKIPSLFKKLGDQPNDLEILQLLQTNLNAERYLRRLIERIA